jgi:hypothetical protein
MRVLGAFGNAPELTEVEAAAVDLLGR